MAQWYQTQLVSMRMRVRSLASLSGLKIWHCHKLRCMSQTWLGSGFAVAEAKASSCSSDSTPSLGTSICHGCGSKKTKIIIAIIKRRGLKSRKLEEFLLWHNRIGGILGVPGCRCDPQPGTVG